MNAPFSAPADVPTIRSGRMPRSYSARSVPAWTAPRLAPPERTKAMSGRWSVITALASAGRAGLPAGARGNPPCPSGYHRTMIGALILGLFAGFIGRALVPNDVFSGMDRGPQSWAVSVLLGL